jgi:hypothetical protein
MHPDADFLMLLSLQIQKGTRSIVHPKTLSFAPFSSAPGSVIGDIEIFRSPSFVDFPVQRGWVPADNYLSFAIPKKVR